MHNLQQYSICAVFTALLMGAVGAKWLLVYPVASREITSRGIFWVLHCVRRSRCKAQPCQGPARGRPSGPPLRMMAAEAPAKHPLQALPVPAGLKASHRCSMRSPAACSSAALRRTRTGETGCLGKGELEHLSAMSYGLLTTCGCRSECLGLNSTQWTAEDRSGGAVSILVEASCGCRRECLGLELSTEDSWGSRRRRW